MTRTVQIKILGLLDIVGDPELNLSLPSGNQARVLLTLLGLSDQYTREQLIGIIWPGDPPASRQNSLSQALGAIRKALGDASGHLRTHKGIVYLDRGASRDGDTYLTTDRLIFNELASSTDREDLLEAVRLHGGTIGRGLSTAGMDTDWLVERQRLQTEGLTDVIRRIFRKENDIAGFVKQVLAESGAAVLSRKLGTVPLTSVTSFSEVGWEELGVTPAVIGNALLPEYLPRAIDRQIDQVLEDAAQAQRTPQRSRLQDRFVLVSGQSKFGKTRALYEAVRRHAVLSDLPTFVPRSSDPSDVAAAVVSASRAREVMLLWLDDLDGCCAYEAEDNGVTAGRLRSALSENPRLVVLGTSGGKGVARIDPREQTTRLGQIWRDILALATTVPIVWQGINTDEVLAARKAGWSDELVIAIERYGLGPALSAGPDLVQTLELARGIQPYGWALVTAVGVLQQQGWFQSSVPWQVARATWRSLTDTALIGSSETRAWEEALTFATHPVYARAQLMTSSDLGLDVHDYVKARLRVSGRDRLTACRSAITAMTASECQSVLMPFYAPSLTSLECAFKVTRDGDGLHADILLDYIADLDAWPNEPDLADAVARLVGRTAPDGASALVLTAIYHPQALSLLTDYIDGIAGSHADLARAAIRLVTKSRQPGDLALIVDATQSDDDDREETAGAIREAMEKHCRTVDWEEVDASLRSSVQPLQTSNPESYIKEWAPLVGLRGVLRDFARTRSSDRSQADGQSLISAVDRFADGHPELVYSDYDVDRAVVILQHDPANEVARATLRDRLDGSPSGRVQQDCAVSLAKAYEKHGEYNHVPLFLDMTPDPFEALILCAPLHQYEPDWLVPWLALRAKRGDLRAAVLALILDDSDHDEAVRLLRKAPRWATPTQIVEIASNLDDNLGLASDLLRSIRGTWPALAFISPDTIEYIFREDASAEEVALHLHDAVNSGSLQAILATERMRDRIGDERAILILDDWRAEIVTSAAPIWEWARTLAWPDGDRLPKRVDKTAIDMI